MKLAKELFTECKGKAMSCSITYQRINDYSVEIYKGHGKTYETIFFTDGHIKPKKAIRDALKFLQH